MLMIAAGSLSIILQIPKVKDVLDVKQADNSSKELEKPEEADII